MLRHKVEEKSREVFENNEKVKTVPLTYVIKYVSGRNFIYFAYFHLLNEMNVWVNLILVILKIHNLIHFSKKL